jgi:hypothetical protein
MGRPVRLRQLSPSQLRRLDVLRRASRMLDSGFVLPGTSYRIGLDPIIGFIPGIGDLVSPLFAIALLWQARDLRLPRVVQLRMLFNVAIDTLIGIVPLAGDLFDFVWKANDKNMALLDRHAYEEHPASAGDWLFVAGMIALVVLIAAIPFVLAGMLWKIGSGVIF